MRFFLLATLAAVATAAPATNNNGVSQGPAPHGQGLSTVQIELFDVQSRPVDRDRFAVNMCVFPAKVPGQGRLLSRAMAGAKNCAYFAAGDKTAPTFQINDNQRHAIRYTLTDVTNGQESRGSFLIDPASGGLRRSTFTFPVFVPTYLSGPDHYQIVTVWRKQAGNARCDFDSILKYPHSSTCPSCVVSTQDDGCIGGTTGYCYAYTWTWPWPSATLYQDDGCGGSQQSSGKEVIDIMEPGQGDYKHMIYANKNEGDFTGSLAQAHVYRKTSTGDIEEIGASYIEDIGTFNGDHRFFHTLSFSLDTWAGTYTMSNVDTVDCAPTTTLGSASVIPAEKKYDSNGLARGC